jgi:hypothetical protein
VAPARHTYILVERLQKLLIIILLLASLFPAWYLNTWLQKVIDPRRSFLRLLLYFVSCFALILFYYILVVFIISRLFPLPKR